MTGDPDAPTKGVRGLLELLTVGAFGCFSLLITSAWLLGGFVALLALRLQGVTLWLASIAWFGVLCGLVAVLFWASVRWLDRRAWSGR